MDLNCARSSEELLEALAEPGCGRIDGTSVAAVFAHPDDETIGFGAQLGRLDGAGVVIVTDGAPRNLEDARRLGFATAEAYAAVRLRELGIALGIAGVPFDRVASLGVPDQEAAFRLPQIVGMLAELLGRWRIRTVVTHAYEGGHPDHDATAFGAHVAAALRRREGQEVDIVEVPLYALGPGGIVRQQFAGGTGDSGIVVHLTARERALKRGMVAAYGTQRAVLAPFELDVERFRPAPRYDFSRLPNGGRLLYEHYPWGLDGRRWSALAHSTRARLGLGDHPC